jgi:hypothetical protein
VQDNADQASQTAKSRLLKILDRLSFWYLARNRFAKNRFHIYIFLYNVYKKYICCCSVFTYIFFYSEWIKSIYLGSGIYFLSRVNRKYISFCPVVRTLYSRSEFTLRLSSRLDEYSSMKLFASYGTAYSTVRTTVCRKYRNRLFPQPPACFISRIYSLF